MKTKSNHGKQHRGMYMLNTKHDIFQAAMKWQKARDEVSMKGMVAQLETEEKLSEVIQAYLKENK